MQETIDFHEFQVDVVLKRVLVRFLFAFIPCFSLFSWIPLWFCITQPSCRAGFVRCERGYQHGWSRWQDKFTFKRHQANYNRLSMRQRSVRWWACNEDNQAAMKTRRNCDCVCVKSRLMGGRLLTRWTDEQMNLLPCMYYMLGHRSNETNLTHSKTVDSPGKKKSSYIFVRAFILSTVKVAKSKMQIFNVSVATDAAIIRQFRLEMATNRTINAKWINRKSQLFYMLFSSWEPKQRVLEWENILRGEWRITACIRPAERQKEMANISVMPSLWMSAECVCLEMPSILSLEWRKPYAVGLGIRHASNRVKWAEDDDGWQYALLHNQTAKTKQLYEKVNIFYRVILPVLNLFSSCMPGHVHRAGATVSNMGFWDFVDGMVYSHPLYFTVKTARGAEEERKKNGIC